MKNPPDWQEVKVILDSALNLAPECRDDFLDRTCGSDRDLRREVEGLLAMEFETDEWLPKPNGLRRAFGNVLATYFFESRIPVSGKF